MGSFTQQQLLKIRDQHEGWLRSQPGFVGSGVGLHPSGELCLKIFSDHMPPAVRNEILKRLDGAPVAIEETGGVRLHSSET